MQDWYTLSEDTSSPSGRFLSVFHNGGGAHLGFDLDVSPPKCTVVWPDDDPQRVAKIWKRMDDWIAAQNEDLDPAR